MKKKIFVFLLLLSSCVAMAIPSVYAEEDSAVAARIENEIEPRRYVAIFFNEPKLSISNRNANVTSDVTITGNYRYEIITTLQRSTNRTSWTNVTSWTESGSGSLSDSFSYSYTTAPNLYYQVTCEINVYNSSGRLIESNTETSSIVRCS